MGLLTELGLTMSYYSELSPQERLKKVSKLLLRGMYLHAKDKGWIKKQPQSPTTRKTKKRKLAIDLDIPRTENKVPAKQFYTLAETAEILEVSKRTLKRWIKAGKVKSTRQENGYQVFNQEELNYLIALNL